MNDDRLEALLRAAVQSAGPSFGATRPGSEEPPPGLAERVRQLQRRRLRNRKFAGGAAVAVLLGLTVYIVGWDKRSAVPPAQMANVESQMTKADCDAIKGEIARLDAEARQRQEDVRRRIAAGAAQLALARVDPEQAEPDPLEVVRIEREKTAFLLVDRADEIGSRAQSAAAAEYRRVVEGFPNTQAAHVAEERLKTL